MHIPIWGSLCLCLGDGEVCTMGSTAGSGALTPHSYGAHLVTLFVEILCDYIMCTIINWLMCTYNWL